MKTREKSKLNKSIMIVGAHADDIELNVGGTALKYLDRGYAIDYVMSTNNMAGAYSVLKDDDSVDVRKLPPAEQGPARKAEAAAAAAALKTTPIHLDHPQRHYNAADGSSIELRYGSPLPETVPANVPSILTAHENEESVRRLSDLIMEKNPEYILTHGMDQVDMEHVGTALLVTKAYWNAVEERGYTGGLLHWRTGVACLGAANSRWDTFVDISQYLERRNEIIAFHKCQIVKPFNPLSPFRQRAIAWGAANGVAAAEVFTVVQKSRLVPAGCNQYAEFSLEIIQHSR